jgi:cytochrome b561
MTERYNNVHIALHWLIALMIFITFPLGLYMADLKPSPTMLKLFSYHKWIGVTIFFLVAIRLAWRRTHPVPPPIAGMPRWQEIASIAIHHTLYLLMVIIPLSGWLMSSADGYQTVWLGIVPLPDLLDKNKELGDTLGEVHEFLNWTMLVLVGLHAAAAIKHQFIDKDGLMQRMNPFSRGQAS